MGNINQSIGDPIIGTGTLDTSGKAVIAVSSLTAGAYTVTALYSKDANYAATKSSPITHAVNRSPTATNMTSDKNPTIFGQTVTLSVAVIPAGAGVPTGTVSFKDGNTLGSGTLDSTGHLAITISSLSWKSCDHGNIQRRQQFPFINGASRLPSSESKLNIDHAVGKSKPKHLRPSCNS